MGGVDLITGFMHPQNKTLPQLASDVARALVHVSVGTDAARISTPLLFPGGARIGIEIARHRNGFLVSDMGGAMREAELMGGERQFSRIAPDVAQRFGVRFDHHMLFDLDVPETEIVSAVIAIANAAKSAVEATLHQLATRETIDLRTILWSRLDRMFAHGQVQRQAVIAGSSEQWEFDAIVESRGRTALFEIIAPHANAVSSAVTKFLDIRDLGDNAPSRVAVLSDKLRTPHITVLGRTAKIVGKDDPDEVFLRAA